jgi:hypothetical protein
MGVYLATRAKGSHALAGHALRNDFSFARFVLPARKALTPLNNQVTKEKE